MEHEPFSMYVIFHHHSLSDTVSMVPSTTFPDYVFRLTLQRGKILTEQQERAVVNLVWARNDIRLTGIRQHILDNDHLFNNVEAISLQTIVHMLKRHQVSLKHLYHVPFERNADTVKQLRTEYVQVCSISR